MGAAPFIGTRILHRTYIEAIIQIPLFDCGSSPGEQLVRSVCQRRTAKRLQQNVPLLFPLRGNRRRFAAGYEQHGNPWMLLIQPERQLRAADVRHSHIGNHQCDRPVASPKDLKRFFANACRACLEPGMLKKRAGERPDLVVVINNQDQRSSWLFAGEGHRSRPKGLRRHTAVARSSRSSQNN